jgi:hypothetical protein
VTLDEFFVKLEQTPRDWVMEERRIRRIEVTRDGWRNICPVMAVDGALDRMGVRVRGVVADSADGIGNNTFLRQRLLKACGLA